MNQLNLENLSISDAFNVVQLLDELPVFDDQPAIEANSSQIDVHTSFDTNFQDREAFVTGVSKYIEEATRHGEFNNMLNEGFQHAANLYTWRCCSRAAPTVKSNDQPDRVPINERIVQVLAPQVAKLLRFMHFSNAAIALFCDEVSRLCHPEKRKDFVSESYLLTLGKFLNMLVVLDELKNMKASIKNDLSTYRRAAQALQSNGLELLELNVVHELSLFLATQHRIKESLKERLVQIENFEDVLADVVNICVYFFENQIYTTPDEKHMFVKVISICLFLIDGNGPNLKKLDQAKRLSIQKLDKLLKLLEVVPLFGDMQVQPFSFVKRSPHYEPSKWPLSHTPSAQCHINVLEKVRQVRRHHDEFVTHLARIKNDVSARATGLPTLQVTICDADRLLTDEENKEMSDLTLNGIRLLCDWTSSVIEVVSWKLDHPTNPAENPDCPEESESYERATRYNYTASEKAALVEMIAMIKGAQLQLSRMETEFSTAIRRFIYAELQDFTQLTLREPLHKAVKHKKDLIATIINSIIDTSADASNLVMSRSMELGGKKKSKKEQSQSMTELSQRKRRDVPPSSTQLYLTRTMLESLVSEKSGGRKVLRKDIEPKHLERMVHFLRQSYFWPPLLRLGRTLEQCGDLAQFWFREFYLEMAMGERIQFPIEMSLPWLLTDYVLTSADPSLAECLLYQLDLYNDAAAFCLKRFRQQHLYDEVEAEVNLCFDQFVFKLSETVFQHYKQLAASMLLDKGFKSDCARMGITLRTPPAARYEALLKQRHVQLLGRSIDLNRLISQRINVALARSLDVAISRFESEGLWYIVPLDQMIETNRLCHQLLSEHLHSLADFEDMLTEANHQVYTTNGRITLHVFLELTGDLMPNFYFNTFTQRFVKGRLRYRNEPQRDRAPVVPAVYEFGSKSLNAAFANICAMHKNYIGVAHFATMAKYLRYQGIATVVEELLQLARQIVDDQIKPHVRILYNMAPKTLKLPRYDYGAEGILHYYLRPAKTLVSYEPLKKDFAQGLRELGNLLAFCFQLESGLAREDLVDLLNSAPFTKAIPKPLFKSREDHEYRLKRLSEQADRLHIASAVEMFGTEVQRALVADTELLTKERLCGGMNIFERILTRIRDFLIVDPLFVGPGNPPNGVMYVDECSEFHRLWSNVQMALFVLHIQYENNKSNEVPSVDEIFGDSLYWAAMAIIRVLNQHRRFDVMDFSYHLLRVFRAEPRSLQHNANATPGKGEGPITLTAVVERIRRQQALNSHILAVLDSHLSADQQQQQQQGPSLHFAPPKFENADQLRQKGPLVPHQLNRNLSTVSANTSSTNINGHQNGDLLWDVTPR